MSFSTYKFGILIAHKSDIIQAISDILWCISRIINVLRKDVNFIASLMSFLIRIHLLLVSLIVGGILYAQNYTYSLQQFQFEDGLLHRAVSTIYQDKQGLIWIGSPNGLQQFDGHEFKSWFDNDATGNKTSISKIDEDDQNWLWLWNTATNKFVFLNTITEEVKSVEQRFGAAFPIKNFQNESGWTFLGDRIPTDTTGRLCFVISNPNKLIYYHSSSGFKTYPLTSLKAKIVELKHLGTDNSLWVVEKNKKRNLVKLSATGDKLLSFQFKENVILNDFTERNGSVFFTAGDTKTEILYEINRQGKLIAQTSKKFLSPEKRFYVSYIWDFSNHQWQVYDSIGNPPLFQIDVLGKKKSLYPTDIRIFEDDKKRAWFYGQYGISVLLPKSNSFTNYFSFEKNLNGPIKSSARGIAADSEHVYVNFEYVGLLKFKKGSPYSWINISNVLNETPYLGRAVLYSNNTYYSAHELGIREYNAAIGKYTPLISSDNPNLSAVWSIYKNNDDIWVGRAYDLAKWNNLEKKYEAIELRNKAGSLIETGEVLQIIAIKSKLVWLCSSKGLLLVDLNKQQVLEHYSVLGIGNYNLPAQYFYSLHIDKNNIYWLGTNSGLIRWDKEANKFRVFNKTDGLSNNTIYSVIEDDYGYLWLSSDYGIMRFNKATNSVATFLEKDGIADNEFNRISAYKAKDGSIYFGGINGVTSFHPKDFLSINEENDQKVLLTNFEVFDGRKGVLINRTGEVRMHKTITISPTNKYIRLKFSVPNYEDDNLNTYAWKLGRETKEWITQTDHRIQFDKLPYGEQILYIKGHNAGGQWSKILQIKLDVMRPFYLRAWFIISLVAALLLATFFLVRRRTAKLLKHAEILKITIKEATYKIERDKNVIQKQAKDLLELDKAKTQFYANVSHELRTPLTLVLGPLENVLNNTAFKLPNEAYDMLKLTMLNSKKLQARVNEILDLSKIDAGKIELFLEPVKLIDLLQSIVQSFNVIAQKREITISLASELDAEIVLNTDTIKIEKVVSNLLSNAVKHSPNGGLIRVNVYTRDNCYNIEVKDNGEGVSKEESEKIFDRYYQAIGGLNQGGTGIGLALCKELAKIMGGDISLVNSERKGATFRFLFKAEEIADSGNIKTELRIEPFDDYDQQSLTVFKSDKPTILVIEDNTEMRYFIKSILQNDYNVLEARDGKVAIEMLKTHKVDLITCDIMMPNMNGLELVSELKKMDKLNNLPVIMLSAKTQLEDKLFVLKLGVDDYMVKPFYSSELQARISNLLSNKEYREQSRNKETLEPTEVVESLWLEKLRITIEQNIANSLFSVADLCESVNIQERTLNRNLGKEIGLSAAAYIKEVRLNKAMDFLVKKQFRSVKEASIAIGFLRPDYFAKEFYKRFGKKPSDYF